MLALPVAEQVAGTLGAALRRSERLLEPTVLLRSVVGHQVDDDAQFPGVRLSDECVEVLQLTGQRADRQGVGNVIASIILRRGEERGKPHSIHPERLERIESSGHPSQIADSVSVRV